VAYTLIIHIKNSDPVIGEVEDLPAPNDTLIAVNNPRRLDGKDLTYLSEDVMKVYWPIDQVNFLEVISSEEEETIIGFVRE